MTFSRTFPGSSVPFFSRITHPSNAMEGTYTHQPTHQEKGSGALGWSTPAYLVNENIVVKNVQGTTSFCFATMTL